MAAADAVGSEETPFDRDYSLHPRYQPGRSLRETPPWELEDELQRNPYGCFVTHETPRQQMQRLGQLREESPAYARALFEQGQALVRLAEQGNLGAIVPLCKEAREGELLLYHVEQMFRAVACGRHPWLLHFMVAEGIQPTDRCAPAAMHWCIDGAVTDEAGTMERETQARIIHCLTILKAGGWDINRPRKPDFWSPLHCAVQHGLGRVVRWLLDEGADPNPVAADDIMPLHLVVVPETASAEEAEPLDVDAIPWDEPLAAPAMEQLLLSFGASREWRRPPPPGFEADERWVKTRAPAATTAIRGVSLSKGELRVVGGDSGAEASTASPPTRSRKQMVSGGVSTGDPSSE